MVGETDLWAVNAREGADVECDKNIVWVFEKGGAFRGEVPAGCKGDPYFVVLENFDGGVTYQVKGDSIFFQGFKAGPIGYKVEFTGNEMKLNYTINRSRTPYTTTSTFRRL